MGLVGNLLGQAGGTVLGGFLGGDKGAQAGRSIGGAIGTALPWFKHGGAVKQTGAAYIHKGEYVLPKGVKPTKAQLAQVAKRKNRM